MKLLLVSCLLIFASCTKEKKCDMAQRSIDVLVPAIASVLDCENKDQIKADLLDLSIKANLCNQKAVPPFICELVAGEVSKLAAKKVPTSWKCDTSNAEEKLEEVLTNICEML